MHLGLAGLSIGSYVGGYASEVVRNVMEKVTDFSLTARFERMCEEGDFFKKELSSNIFRASITEKVDIKQATGQKKAALSV